MNKKAIFTIILAAILAFTFAFLFLRKTTNDNKIVEPQQQEVIQEDIKEPETETKVENKTETTEVSKTTTKTVKNTAKTTAKTEAPVINKIVVEEAKNEEISTKTEDSGIVVDKNSDVIEITREFKTDVPVKYSFKGYGVLDNSSVK